MEHTRIREGQLLKIPFEGKVLRLVVLTKRPVTRADFLECVEEGGTDRFAFTIREDEYGRFFIPNKKALTPLHSEVRTVNQ